MGENFVFSKNFVLTSRELRNLPKKLKTILKRTEKLDSEQRAIMIQAYVSIPVAADELSYKFELLLEIFKARARVYCPYCQKRVVKKYALERVKKIRNCRFCKGIGSLTRVEIEKIEQQFKTKGVRK